MPGSAVQRVADGCRRVLADLPAGSLRDALEQVHAGLEEPLRIAVAGRLKAGKSTLVNALLGQRIAATDVAECTKVVTEFRFGFPERVHVVHRDGTRRELPLELDSNGAARIPLDGSAAEVEWVRVTLSNAMLRDFTLIDTPGLASLTPGMSQRTSELLAIDEASRSALSRAHAVIFLISQSPKKDEVDSLRSLRDAMGGAGGSAGNAVAVMTKADKLSDMAGTDPWELAVAIADRYSADPILRTVVASVVPVIGLLAETAESGLLTEADVKNLRLLASAGPDQREVLLMGADAFLSTTGPVPRDQAARLLGALDLYGLRRALRFIDTQDADASALHRHLRRISGIDRLRQLLDALFGARADLLKADAALASLERVVHALPTSAADRSSRTVVRDMLEEIRLDPAMHALAEIHVLRTLAVDDSISLPTDLSDDMRRVLTERDLATRLGVDGSTEGEQLREAAMRGAARWNAFRNGGRAGPSEARIADVVHRTYSLLWEAADSSVATR